MITALANAHMVRFIGFSSEKVTIRPICFALEKCTDRNLALVQRQHFRARRAAGLIRLIRSLAAHRVSPTRRPGGFHFDDVVIALAIDQLQR